MPIEFRILGTLEVAEGERRLSLGGQRQRALLALLLLHANEVVSRDRLIDDVWDEEPPASVDNAVQVYVSRLRKLLQSGDGGSTTLLREGRGYMLRIEPEQLDATRFEQLVRAGRQALAEGDNERAADVLRDALALWRGPPLADLAYSRFAQSEIARLEELRLSVLEARIETDLALGNHELVPELEALVAEHPYRERLRAYLMLALYRSGRQADALDAYAHARSTLDELGLEPSEELRRLQTQILQHDPALERPPATDRPTPITGRRSRRALALRATGLVVAPIILGGALLAFSDVGRHNGTHAAVIVPRNSVVAIDPDTNTVVAEAPTDARPSGLAVGRRAIWVGDYDDNVLLRIDPRSHRVVRAITVGGDPEHITTGRTAVWVTSSGGTRPGGTVSRVDARTFLPKTVRVRQTVPGFRFTSAEPGARGVAIGAGSVWVAHSFSLVSRLDPASASVVKSIMLLNPPQDLAFGSGGLWVTTTGEPSVLRIDPRTNRVDLDLRVGGELDVLSAIATGEGAVWVASRGPGSDTLGKLWRIDATGRVTAGIRVGRYPLGVAVGEGAVWVANYRDGTVSRIDPETQKVVATIKVRRGVAEVAVGEGAVWATVRDPTRPAHGLGTNRP